MDKSAFIISLLSIVQIALLGLWLNQPDGRLNRNWFLTALPFIACIGLLSAGAAGALHPEVPHSWTAPLDVVGSAVAAASIGLLFATWGTHRSRLSLWHQENDAPETIVTQGPYSAIRHPFYTSFLLGVISVVLVLPSWITLCALGYAVIALNVTAAREERRLAASRFGAEYQAYVLRTGRFVPRAGLSRGVRSARAS
ncbi:MAG TPA: isoprenylcysteine carboxylmethyltransferase family protein [Streptosporangiaceae bacterium]|jgi:protein-S-isoprenylcysteine O-methyltransferase Ste14